MPKLTVAVALAWGLTMVPTASAVELLPLFVEEQVSGAAITDGLGGAYSVAVSPDGAHVYAVGLSQEAVVVFERQVGTGYLVFVEAHFDDQAGVDGLAGAQSVTVSPDGAHVYVAGSVDDAIAVFSRNAATGELGFVELERDGVGGVDGINGIRSVVVSGDGAHVYAVGFSENTIAVFARDMVTGELTFVETHRDGVAGVTGLVLPAAVAISPDDAHVYAAGGVAGEIAVFSRNAGTGALTFVEALFDGQGGVMGIDGAVSVVVSPDGSHVYVAATSDSVAVFSRNAGTGELSFVEALFDGTGGITGLEYATAVVTSPDGSHVYASGLNDDAVVVFGRNPGTGQLTLIEEVFDETGGITDGLNGPRAIALSPDGAHVYVASYFDAAVTGFERDVPSGTLQFAESQRNGAGGVALAGAISVAVSPDGSTVYVGSFGDDTVVAFDRDAGSGALTFVDVEQDGLAGTQGLGGVRAVAVSPDGASLYAAALFDDSLAVFDRDPGTGELSFVEVHFDDVAGIDGLDRASDVALSPGGEHVYVAGRSDNAVAVFDRDAGTGAVTFVEAVVNNQGGVVGIGGAVGVDVSPDGAHVYVAGSSTDTVAVFSRNPATGQLVFVESHLDDFGAEGLEGAHDVAVSPDGASVYVVGSEEDAVAIFDRDPATGELTQVGFEQEGVGIVGINDPLFVAIHPDGRHVFVSGTGPVPFVTDETVATFERDPASGDLTPAHTLGQTDSAQLSGVGMAVSPDGAHLYTPGPSSLQVFALVPTCPAAPDPGCRQPIQPRAAKLILKDSAQAGKARVVWKWGKGEVTSAADLGDPVTTSHYSLCLYDAGAGVQPRMTAAIPADGLCFGTHPNDAVPCWNASGSSGERFRYLDRNSSTGLTPDGVERLKIQAGEEGRAKAQVKGRGVPLQMPALPMVAPVLAQLRNLETGACFQAVYSTPNKNDPAQFKAKSD